MFRLLAVGVPNVPEVLVTQESVQKDVVELNKQRQRRSARCWVEFLRRQSDSVLLKHRQVLENLPIAFRLLRLVNLSGHLLDGRTPLCLYSFFDIAFVVALLSVLLLDKHPVHLQLVIE